MYLNNKLDELANDNLLKEVIFLRMVEKANKTSKSKKKIKTRCNCKLTIQTSD